MVLASSATYLLKKFVVVEKIFKNKLFLTIRSSIVFSVVLIYFASICLDWKLLISVMNLKLNLYIIRFQKLLPYSCLWFWSRYYDKLWQGKTSSVKNLQFEPSRLQGSRKLLAMSQITPLCKRSLLSFYSSRCFDFPLLPFFPFLFMSPRCLFHQFSSSIAIFLIFQTVFLPVYRRKYYIKLSFSYQKKINNNNYTNSHTNEKKYLNIFLSVKR